MHFFFFQTLYILVLPGCMNLEDAKYKAKKHGVVLNGKDECNSVEERGEIIGNAIF